MPLVILIGVFVVLGLEHVLVPLEFATRHQPGVRLSLLARARGVPPLVGARRLVRRRWMARARHGAGGRPRRRSGVSRTSSAMRSSTCEACLSSVLPPRGWAADCGAPCHPWALAPELALPAPGIWVVACQAGSNAATLGTQTNLFGARGRLSRAVSSSRGPPSATSPNPRGRSSHAPRPWGQEQSPGRCPLATHTVPPAIPWPRRADR